MVSKNVEFKDRNHFFVVLSEEYKEKIRAEARTKPLKIVPVQKSPYIEDKENMF